MDGPRDYHTKQSKSERERQRPYDYHLYAESKIRYKLISETESQTRRTDLWLPRERDGMGGLDWELGTSRCKVLHIEWINNEVLLYSTGNHI